MIHFVSHNPGKVREMQALIPNIVQLDLDLTEIQSLDSHEVIAHKLEEASRHHQGPLFVDDTCLVLNCIAPLPGPLMKWFIKGIGLQGIVDLTERFNDTAATARTTLGLRDSGGHDHFFIGEIAGRISAPAGDGFGWDNIFIPVGYSKSFGQLGPDVKSKISMRTKAARLLADHLRA